MKVIRYENVVGCDIDDTILMWDNPTVNGPGKFPIQFAGRTVYLTPHTYHVDLLKMYHERGYYIQFWSANGYQHAERAVIALGLQHLADGENGHIQAKLCKHMDDNPDAASIIGPRVYCADLTKPVPTAVLQEYQTPSPSFVQPFHLSPSFGGIINCTNPYLDKPNTLTIETIDNRGTLNGR